MTEFVWPVRVYYEDTDNGGVVYYANYLKFMERARTEWLRAKGYEQDKLITEDALIFAVRSAKLDFLQPAKFNDALEVSALAVSHKAASIVFKQEVRRKEEVLCSGEVSIACLSSDSLKPRRMPKAMIEELMK